MRYGSATGRATATRARSSRASTRCGCSRLPARARPCSTSTSRSSRPRPRSPSGTTTATPSDFGVAYLHDRLVIEATSDVVTHAGADDPLAGPAEGEPDASPSLRALVGNEALADEHAEFLGPSAYIPLGDDSAALAEALLAEDREASALAFLTSRSRPCARTPRVPDRLHDREQLRRRGARRRERRLPGLRARADLAVPPRRPPRSLRQRVPRRRRRGDGIARLDRGVHPALWVARYRRDARHALHGAARQGRRGPRLRSTSRCCAAPIRAAARPSSKCR